MMNEFEFYKETNFKETPIGKIPKDWEAVKLSDIAEDIYYGITAKAVENTTELRMLRTTDIKDYNVNWNALPFCEITEKRSKVQQFLLKQGDLIIARAGTTGVSVLVDKDLENVIFGSYLIKIRLSEKAFPKFIHYFCQSRFYWKHITSSQAGSTLKNISLPILKSLNVPLPPFAEQQKIAEILSIVDEAIQKTNEVIAKTERLKKGLMQELLTRGIGHKEFKDTEIGRIPKEWEVVKVDRLFDLYKGTTPSTKIKEYWNGTIPFVTPTDITKINDSNEIYLEGTETYITEKGLISKGLKIVPRNSLLFTSRATIGYLAINNTEVTINQGIISLIPKDSNIDVTFFYYSLQKLKTLFESLAGGSTYKEISMSTFSNVSVPLPSLSEQQKIAETLLKVDKKLKIERNEKAKLERIKQGLMDLLLTGKIRVKVNRE